MNEPLPEIFSRFAGMKIDHEEIETRRFGKQKRITEAGKKQINEIHKIAAENNVELRIWFPGGDEFSFVKQGRCLNIYTDSDWVVSNQWNYDPA